MKTGRQRTLPHPFYCLSPDGRWGLAPDFRRLNDTRPGYGYAGVPDPNAKQLAPGDAGIWKMDLATGKQELLLSFADAARIPYPDGFSTGAKHWFNHLLFNTYVPGTRNEWVLNDTYPDKQRLQHPYLFHIPTNRRAPLAHLLSPAEYTGEWRCDTHSSASRDGKWVTVDSPHGGNGRQVYLIDSSSV